jgi:hypothetical protein
MRRRLGNSFPVRSIVAFFEDFSFRILTMVPAKNRKRAA